VNWTIASRPFERSGLHGLGVGRRQEALQLRIERSLDVAAFVLEHLVQR
jgi:hypothetical protein